MTAQLGRRGLAPEEEVRVLWELGMRGDLVFCSGGPEDLHLSTLRPENRLPAKPGRGRSPFLPASQRPGVPWCAHTQAPVGTVEAGLVP